VLQLADRVSSLACSSWSGIRAVNDAITAASVFASAALGFNGHYHHVTSVHDED
jgi:Na+/H+ antiporter NhaB